MPGPARLCQALGITGSLDGADLTRRADGPWIGDDGIAARRRIRRVAPRIGLTKGAEHPWRWFVPGDAESVSPAA